MTNLQVIASDCLASSDNDLSSAVDEMVRRIQTDEKLYRELMDPLVREACYNLIRAAIRKRREHIWVPPNYDKGGRGDRIRKHAQDTLYNFPLPRNGKPLGEAVKAEVSEAAQFYTERASNMQTKGRWLGAIASALKSDELPVSHQLSLAALKALKDGRPLPTNPKPGRRSRRDDDDHPEATV